MMIFLALNTEAQKADSIKTFNHDMYLKKAKSRLVTGYVLAGIGLTSLTIFVIKGQSFDIFGGDDAAAAFCLIGTVCTVASIPYFLSAGSNKRKAARTLVKLNVIKVNDFVYNNKKQLGLSLNIPLK